MSKFKQIPWGKVGTVLAAVALVVLGVAGTLKYQQFIANTKAQGVSEYKAIYCREYSDKDNKAHWLECDMQ